MHRRRSYLRQYRKTYLEKRLPRAKISLLALFIAAVGASLAMFVYIFVHVESGEIAQQNEASLVINQAVSVKKKPLRVDFTAWNQTCDWNLVVVNDRNRVPEFFVPKLAMFGDIEVDERIVSPLREMLNDAAKDGIRLWVSTGYRSIERQESLFNRRVSTFVEDGLPNEDAFKLVLRETSLPGYSEHNTGLAVDFNAADVEFAETPEYDWLIKNASNYGFILRYPQEKDHITGRAFEPAHFRYVGEEHAKVIAERSLSLEEYSSELIK